MKTATTISLKLFAAPIDLRRRRLENNLSEIEFLLLCSLMIHENITATELCDAFGLSRTSLSRCSFALANRGLVCMDHPTKDRRLVTLSLTREGATLICNILKPETKAVAA